MAGEIQGTEFLPRWRSRLPNGDLSPEYGPSLATAVRHRRDLSMFTWRPPPPAPTPPARGPAPAPLLASPAADSIPDRERDVYQALYVSGLGYKRAAESLGVSRSTVKTLAKRLRARVS
jgi:DNA-directed RNA polymerase specialized sigma24 family protein